MRWYHLLLLRSIAIESSRISFSLFGKEFVVWNLGKHILHDVVDYLAERLEHRSSDFGKYVTPIFIQKQIHIVTEQFVAVEQILQIEYHSGHCEREFRFFRLQIHFSVFLFRFAGEANQHIRIDCEIKRKKRRMNEPNVYASFLLCYLLIVMLLSPSP